MIRRSIAISGFLALALLGGLGITAFATDNSQTAVAVGIVRASLDAALVDDIQDLLRADVGLAGSLFEIDSEDGVVTLGGTVPDEYALRRAMDLTCGVKGVKEVRNALKIEFPK